MTNALMTTQDQEESLSRVYAHAVAAGAGYIVSNHELDRDGVDLTIHAGGEMRPALALQLKATVNLGEPKDGYFRFSLKRRNYDLLIQATQTPRLLMVLDLPKNKDEWLTFTVDSLVLRRRAYWLNLKGCRETTNLNFITVSIPTTNLLDIKSLRELMKQSQGGNIR